MSRKRSGWRAAERTYNWLTADVARKARESIAAERLRLADTVCPDGAACPDPKCQTARAAALRGAGWREVSSILAH